MATINFATWLIGFCIDTRDMDKKFWTNEDGHILEVPSINDLCFALKEKFARQERELEMLRVENDKLKSGIWREEEMARLKSKYDKMEKEYHRGFPISEHEQEMINQFVAEHRADFGAIGGGFTYRFVPTSIGVASSIVAVNGDELVFRELG